MNKKQLEKLKKKLPKKYYEKINAIFRKRNRKTFSRQYIDRVLSPKQPDTNEEIIAVAIEVAETYQSELQEKLKTLKEL